MHDVREERYQWGGRRQRRSHTVSSRQRQTYGAMASLLGKLFRTAKDRIGAGRTRTSYLQSTEASIFHRRWFAAVHCFFVVVVTKIVLLPTSAAVVVGPHRCVFVWNCAERTYNDVISWCCLRFSVKLVLFRIARSRYTIWWWSAGSWIEPHDHGLPRLSKPSTSSSGHQNCWSLLLSRGTLQSSAVQQH